MIRRQLYPELDLIVHTVDGPLGLHDFRAATKALYELEPPPRLSFWDLAAADLDDTTIQMSRVAQSGTATAVRGREGGKTAIVAPSDLIYATARQYETIAESLALPFQQRVFRDADEAWAWLGIDRADLDPRDCRELPQVDEVP